MLTTACHEARRQTGFYCERTQRLRAIWCTQASQSLGKQRKEISDPPSCKLTRMPTKITNKQTAFQSASPGRPQVTTVMRRAFQTTVKHGLYTVSRLAPFQSHSKRHGMNKGQSRYLKPLLSPLISISTIKLRSSVKKNVSTVYAIAAGAG